MNEMNCGIGTVARAQYRSQGHDGAGNYNVDPRFQPTDVGRDLGLIRRFHDGDLIFGYGGLCVSRDWVDCIDLVHE